MTDPIHDEEIQQIDGGYVVRCKCGRLETWRATECRAIEAFIEHVEDAVPGIFDEKPPKHTR